MLTFTQLGGSCTWRTQKVKISKYSICFHKLNLWVVLPVKHVCVLDVLPILAFVPFASQVNVGDGGVLILEGNAVQLGTL